MITSSSFFVFIKQWKSKVNSPDMFTMKYNSSLACKTKKNRFLLDFNLDNNTQVNYFSQFGEEDYNYGNLAVCVIKWS